MFPLSDTFVELAVLCAIFAFCAFCVLLFERFKPILALPMVSFVGYGIWALWSTGGGYEGLGVMFLLLEYFGVGMLGGAWALAILGACILPGRRGIGFGPIAQSLFVIVPVIAVIGYGAIAQYVPSSTCTQNDIAVQIGQDIYVIERQHKTLLRFLKKSGQSQLRYSNRSKDKEDLIVLCALADQGQTPIVADQMWVTPASKMDIDGLSQMMVVSQSMFTRPRYGGTVSWVERVEELSQRPEFVGAGNNEGGHLCRKFVQASRAMVRCQIWFLQDAETIVIGHSGRVEADQHDAVLTDLQTGLAKLRTGMLK
ncbi:hypothetical protein [Amylibacter sp. IMCC11727]|uniref:hypothetical protein n=1 Tax=Amylibacter sp. IMCC11727 TaxID=3039851 RepID=UPI00244E3BBD|nr:hypothetical protein [Amylibacter sp. IMCC11727]WGI22805.1 hypothetical protein QBD29_05135 [Amylibacter sp. IMCC11727]